MPCNFKICGKKGTFITSSKSPDIFQYENIKKIEFAAFLGSLMNSQNDLISYHKMTIVSVSLRLAVPQSAKMWDIMYQDVLSS